MTDEILSVSGVSKIFGETTALCNVDLRIRKHEVVGLIGENGSGKSTLLKILAGVHRPTSGELFLNGRSVSLNGVADASAMGIGMVYQEQSLIPNITVAENILLGNEGDSVRFGWYNWRKLHAQAREVLNQLDLDIDPDAKTEDLSFAQRQMVEIAKILFLEKHSNHEPLMLFDEPTSVLESNEVQTLFRQIRRLREIGSVVFVSHRLNEVLEISDRIYVFKDGRCVGECNPKTCHTNELYEMMVGRPASGSHYREADQLPFDESKVTLSLEALSSSGNYTDVDISVHGGEVLALTGLIGSGCEGVCRTIFGAEACDSGIMYLNGAALKPKSPAEAVRLGIGYISAERHIEGIILGMSVAANMVLVAPTVVRRGPFLIHSLWKKVVADWIGKLRIRTLSGETNITLLSGGNQQKVVLAKWLLYPNLKLLVLDHPARGLDVGAKEDVYAIIRQLAKQGLSIILLADTVDEAIALSHNVIVMRDGKISGRFAAPRGNKPTESEIVKCMI
ncbi:MAG: sugar ABC transporter ATP-binding protein [Acidiphilium sp.]